MINDLVLLYYGFNDSSWSRMQSVGFILITPKSKDCVDISTLYSAELNSWKLFSVRGTNFHLKYKGLHLIIWCAVKRQFVNWKCVIRHDFNVYQSISNRTALWKKISLTHGHLMLYCKNSISHTVVFVIYNDLNSLIDMSFSYYFWSLFFY